MEKLELQLLLDKYITGELSQAERARLAELAGQPAQEATLEGFVRQVMMTDEFAGRDEPRVKEAILAHLEKNMGAIPTGDLPAGAVTMRPYQRRAFLRYAVAAAVLVILAGSVWLWRAGRAGTPASIAEQPVRDVAPGHEGAVLTLADGKQIVLDSSSNGSLARQGNASVTKLNAGQLTYQAENATTGTTAEVMYNTLTTPRGRRSSVLLSDGTRVWLNAASSIRFPTVFAGKDRTVEVSGEAYFEVAKDLSLPFIVKTVRTASQDPLEIQVLGTSFNITAYSDENEVSTTLVEGSVKVISGSAARLITPGQQLVAKPDGRLELNPGVDVQKVIAWKDGNFLFRGDELTTIMKQLSRWYDIEVHFDGTVSDHYTGKISRQVNISQVLKMLQAAGGVSFSVQNKEVRVLPKTM
jgi:ferric-dicitrate binding protein FerR (iron transport regulator)